MALITLPTKFAFSRVNKFALERRTNTLRSLYTGQRQSIIYPFAIWTLDGTLREYDGVDAASIRSFLAKLEGQKNTFQLIVPGYIRPSTGYTGSALTNGATAVRAVSINIDGLNVNEPIFNAGDFFTVYDELKIVTSSVSSNASGQATVSFQPPLRKAVPDNVFVFMQNPYCLMTAADDDIAAWDIAPPVRQQSKFTAIEAI